MRRNFRQLWQESGGPGSLVAARVAAQILQFALFLIAARTMTSAEFGVFSLIFAIAVGLTVLAEAGWTEFAIARSEEGAAERIASIALVFGMVLGAIGIIGCGIAGLTGSSGEIVLTGAMLVVWIALRPVTMVQTGVLTREGRLVPIAIIQTLCEVGGFVASAAMLLQGYGILALAAGKVVLQLTATLGVIFYAGRPRWHWPERDFLHAAIVFSRRILVGRVLGFLQGNFSTLIIGGVQSAHQVGLYRAAVRIVGSAQELAREPARYAVWSKFKSATHDLEPEQRKRALSMASSRFLGWMYFLSAPLLIAIGALADQIVSVLLGPAWAEAAPLIAILSFAACAKLITVVVEPYFALIDRAELIQKFSIVSVGSNMVMLAIAVQFSLEAVAYTELAGGLFTAFFGLYLLRREGGASMRAMFAELVPVIVGAVGCLAVILACSLPPSPSMVATIVSSCAAGFAGVVVYLALFLGSRRLLPAKLR